MGGGASSINEVTMAARASLAELADQPIPGPALRGSLRDHRATVAIVERRSAWANFRQ